MNRHCASHVLVCWLTNKVLSARSPVDHNKKPNFELWYNVGIYLADRQKSRHVPAPVRGPALETHWSGLEGSK